MITKKIVLSVLVFSMLLFFGCSHDVPPPPPDGNVTPPVTPLSEQEALEIAHQTEEGAFAIKQQNAFSSADQCTQEEYEQSLVQVTHVLEENGVGFNTNAAQSAMAFADECNLEIEENIEKTASGYDVSYKMKTSDDCSDEDLKNNLNMEELLGISVDENRESSVQYDAIDLESRELLDLVIDSSGNCYAQIFILSNLQDVETAIPAFIGLSSDALVDAYNSLNLAIEEGRTEGYLEANEKYEEAITAYNSENYEEALILAQEAKELADAATVPEVDPPQPSVPNEAQESYDALVETYNELNAAYNAGKTQGYADANAKYEEALAAYNSGDYSVSLALAQEAKTLAQATTVPTPTTLTKDQAADIVIQQVIDPLTNKDQVEAYAYPTMLTAGDSYTVIESGHTKFNVQNDGWLFWVDKAPDARFGHPVDVVFVDAATGAFTLNGGSWWPRVNNEMMGSDVYQNFLTYNIYYRGVTGLTTIPKVILDRLAVIIEFGFCNAPADSRKMAIVVYAMADDSDTPIKQDAKNMYTALCKNGYQTTVLTSNESSDLKSKISAQIKIIADGSKQPDSSLNSFVFYTVTHGEPGSGDLIINIRGTAWEEITQAEISSLVGDGALMGEMWSETYTVIQDSCYSGNAIDSYPPKASSNFGDVGWVLSSQNKTTQGYGDPNKNQTSVFTNALVECMKPLIKADELHGCIKPKVDTALAPWVAEGYAQNPMYTKLTDITDDIVPVFSQ